MDPALLALIQSPGLLPQQQLQLLAVLQQPGLTPQQQAAIMAAVQRPQPKPQPKPRRPAVDEDEGAGGVQADSEENIFHRYVCRSGNPAPHHPGDIVESVSLAGAARPVVRAERLADADLPPAAFPILESLGPQVAAGKLSDLQLEGVQFAAQRHQQFLSGGSRAAFYIADSAGVGKGRQIAAIVIDSVARGRPKHLWFSASSDLIEDARRDLRDLDCPGINVVNGCQELDSKTKAFGLSSSCKTGVMFSTYATLASSGGSGKQSRIQQLIQWCGPQFDGVVAFDECHKAKNFKDASDERAGAGTKIGQAVMQLQAELPRARVVFASATGVTELKNMSYMTRLGLWGPGTSFEDFQRFKRELDKRGVGALEMLAIEMKTQGMYVSRGLGFSQAEFVIDECPITPGLKQMYDGAVELWQELGRAFRQAPAEQGAGRGFWGHSQRFFKQMAISIKVDHVVRKTQEALAQGFAVVIGLQTTGEASMEQELRKAGRLEGQFVSTVREMLTRLIGTLPETTKSGESLPELAATKRRLMDRAQHMELPNAVLDSLIDGLGGPDKVSEMTGRSGRIIRKRGSVVYEQRGSKEDDREKLNVNECKRFQNGDKLVAIISDAASTGISLHASRGVRNQRRRMHITLELPWSADKAIQQLGRTHRSNAVSAPLYALVTSKLAGERRFIAAIAGRLQSLGALTKGDRRAASGQDLSQFHFDTRHGRRALADMVQSACDAGSVHAAQGMMMGHAAQPPDAGWLELYELMSQASMLDDATTVMNDASKADVKKFLNRLLCVHIDGQDRLFSKFSANLSRTVAAAKSDGTYEDGMADLRGSSITTHGAPSDVHCGLQYRTLRIDRGIGYERATQMLRDHPGVSDKSGFYRLKQPAPGGRRHYCLALRKQGFSSHGSPPFLLSRPNTGTKWGEEIASEFLRKYERVEPADAEAAWVKMYQQTESGCMHGASCSKAGRGAGGRCITGTRMTDVGILFGKVVPYWGAIQQVITASRDSITAEERAVRVVRAETTEAPASRHVGVRFPPHLLKQLRDHLAAHDKKPSGPVQSVLSFNSNPMQPAAPSVLPAAPSPPPPAEDPAPVVAAAMKKMSTVAQKTLQSFFGKPAAERAPPQPKPLSDLERAIQASLQDTNPPAAQPQVIELSDSPPVAQASLREEPAAPAASGNTLPKPRAEKRKAPSEGSSLRDFFTKKLKAKAETENL